MLKAALFYTAVAMMLVIAVIAQRRREAQRSAVRYEGRSRLNAEDTQ